MYRKLALAFAVLLGVLAGPAVAGSAQQPETPDWAGSVQLNQDTAAATGLVNKYSFDDVNVALGGCLAPAAGTLTAPDSTRFSSPVLRFSDYTFEPFASAPGNVSATAELVAGTAPGSYPLTMSCNGQDHTVTFTVERQVRKVPDGAVSAGGGGTAR
ncbi:hypothetical protein [Amycolatopsis nigrescens]|uniref:hypothetical protein n=1 Tax=Amycolatopsis nigrescens TaxID=381445 RepID=UPI00037867F0|nr:hypothetical protein [Amycolatopsis nigrescens]